MEPPRGDEVSASLDGRLVSRAVRIADPSRRAVIRQAAAPAVAWTDPDGTTIVGSGATARLVADGPDRFATIRRASEAVFADADVSGGPEAARPRLFGGFAFHDDHAPAPPWGPFPGATFVLPETQVTWTADGVWLTVTGTNRTDPPVGERIETVRAALATQPEPGPIGPTPAVRTRRRTPDRPTWRRTVRAAIDRIDRDELQKVVLAQALEADLGGRPDPGDLLARLGRANPDCYRFLLTFAATTLVGATPERLVSLRGRTVETGALAGTTGRGETPAEDEWLATELSDDAKNAHEHDLVADAIRAQLEPFATTVQTADRHVRRLASVQHLETPITAELAADEHVLTLVEALHPTPAVGGLPPDRALATIRETEPFERGWYAAPVGWIDAAGDGTFAVAIRSAVTAGATATLFAGVGIVGDSDPDREWDEVQLKYRPVLDALE